MTSGKFDHETQIAIRIQSGIEAILGGSLSLDYCRPAAVECIRFELPVPDLIQKVQSIVSREWSKDPNWAPKSDGWFKIVVTEEARRLGKIHAGEVVPPDGPPTQPRPRRPQVIANATGGRIVGMSRMGGLKQFWRLAA